MLELKPQVINGIYLFPDNIDPSRYYYLLQEPQIAQRNGEFQIKLIKYSGAVKGGMFSLEVDLNVEQERLQQVSREMKIPGVQLEPVAIIDGSVKLIILDKIYKPQKPALFGNNQAVFCLSLTQDEVVILEQALLEAEFTTIGVVYALDYLALRPSYAYQLRANWERVQQYIEEKFGLNFVFFKVDIENVIDQLIENRSIEIKLDSFTPEDEDSKNRDRILQEIQSMVLSTFFEPTLKPVPIKDKSGEFSLLPGFSYRRIDITTIDQRFLNLTVNEETTVRRSIYPQGNLQGFLQLIQQGKLDCDRIITTIDLDDPFFRHRQVQVISRGNFEEDGISQISVTLQYGDELKTILLQSSTDRKNVEPWNSILNDGVVQRDVKAKYTVSFKNFDSSQRPNTLESPETVTIFNQLEIVPRELYSIIPVSITTSSTFPWERYETVQVKILYQDEANKIRLEPNFYLNRQNYQQIWKMFVGDRLRKKFQYQLSYQPTSGNSYYKTSWLEAEEQIIVHNPFPQERTLTVIPLFSWSEIREVEVQLNYQDPSNNINENQVFLFSESDSENKIFSARMRNPELRLVTYYVTIFFADEKIWQLPRSVTLDKRIFLTQDMKAHQIVAISAEKVDFEANQIKEITVEISYEDAKAGLFNKSNYVFDSSGDRAYFEFDYLDARRQHYQYRTTYLFTNGIQGTTDWQIVDSDKLILESKTSDFFHSESITENLTVEISAKNLNWQQIESVKVLLAFEDKNIGIKEASEAIYFREKNQESFFWEVELKNSPIRTYKWQAIVYLRDKSVNRKDKIYHPGPTAKNWQETDKQQLNLKDYLKVNEK
ncbi:hypothetical protein NIES37_38440 [Tolypothrix tenuis PCC 7101]|uniref:Uncharacterized protein n=1 Tax=Tolypothrix tenuis PCC 7101 TaxID=231146 RepID=A0A1Z4N2K6_9CYAN|nr:hypothetical protein [Aulosira sp. FACHB-113]BAY99861.1 hypothetical protein NIES37_38440 [Tolypothrix tenuis PCC 7101]BAZ76217.1 hypothetical protein NIES50_48150 [Aulosira laxa NIES-50]